jgi:hypothetical protein
MELLFKNCYQYNKPGETVWNYGKELEKSYNEAMHEVRPREVPCEAPVVLLGMRMGWSSNNALTNSADFEDSTSLILSRA